MNTLSRKQREIQERETRILDLAREMLMREGYLRLSMDRIAEELQYAKGTVYRHFPNKEDIIMALAVETAKKRTSIFQRASVFPGSSRERMTAIAVGCELFLQLYPSHFNVEQIVRLTSIWEKTSEKRQNVMHTCEQTCMSVVSGVVRDGIARKELELPDGMTPEQLVFGLWSINFGSNTLMVTSNSLAEVGIEEPNSAIRSCISGMLDGFQWKPLSYERDYQEVYQKALKEVFPDEFRQLTAAE